MEERKATTHYNFNICKALDFVCRARSTDSINPALKGVCIDYHNHRIITTNDQRAHAIEFIGDMKTEFKECFKWLAEHPSLIPCSFEVEKTKEGYSFVNEFDGNFPGYVNIFPDYDSNSKELFPYKKIVRLSTPDIPADRGLFVSRAIHYSQHIIDADHVRDLIPNKCTKKTVMKWDIFAKDANNKMNSPVVFESWEINGMIFKAVIISVKI